MIAAIILAFLKAIPFAARLWDDVALRWQFHRIETTRTTAHDQIEKDKADTLAGGWLCPMRCPYRLQHQAAPGPGGAQQNPSPAKPS